MGWDLDHAASGPEIQSQAGVAGSASLLAIQRVVFTCRRVEDDRVRQCDVMLGTVDLVRADRCCACCMRSAGLRVPLCLLPAVEGVVYQQPADCPVGLGDRSGLWSADAVGFGGAGVVVDQVGDGGDVQCGHRRRPTLARLPV